MLFTGLTAFLLATSALIAPTTADVGFFDTDTYLVTTQSADGSKVSFSLSQNDKMLIDQYLTGGQFFEVDALSRCIEKSALSNEVKEELLLMLQDSFASTLKSREFLGALVKTIKGCPGLEHSEL